MKTAIIILFIGLALAAAFLSFAFLQFDPNALRPEFEAHLARILQADVELGSVSLQWGILPEITLRDLRVVERETKELLLECGQARTRVQLFPLLKRELWAQSFDLDSPHFVFFRRPQKNWNWNTALFNSASAPPEKPEKRARDSWRFHLGSLHAKNARLNYEDQTATPPFQINLSRIEVKTSSLDPLSSFQLWFELPAGGLPFSGAIRVDGSSQQLRFEGKLGENAVTAELEVTDFLTAPRFEIKLRAQALELGDLGPLAAPLPFSGKLSGDWKATGEGLHPKEWGQTLILSGHLYLGAGEIRGMRMAPRVFEELAEIPVPGLSELPSLDYSFDFDAILKSAATPFESAAGKIQWAKGKLFLNDILLKHSDYQLQLNGSFQSRDRYVDLRGAMAFTSDVSTLILTEIPEMEALKNLADEILVPVEYRGTFPKADVFVDHDFIANRFIQMHGEVLASLGIQKLNEYLEAHRT